MVEEFFVGINEPLEFNEIPGIVVKREFLKETIIMTFIQIYNKHVPKTERLYLTYSLIREPVRWYN